MEWALDIEFDEILQRVSGHTFWLTYLSEAIDPMSLIGIHVAIFTEPFLLRLCCARARRRVHSPVSAPKSLRSL